MAEELKRLWKWLTFAKVSRIILLVLLALLVLVIWQNGLRDLFSQDGSASLLTRLSQVDFGRFLITALIVLIVVIIAANMAFGLFNPKMDTELPLEKRFLLGKELLTVFIGLLGTLMGFYFAENRVSPDNVQKIANTVKNEELTDKAGVEKKAIDFLLKKDFDGAVKGFEDAHNVTPALANIGNIDAIRKLLADNKDEFSKGNDVKKNELWQKLFCAISTGGLTIGMTDDMKKTVQGYCTPPPIIPTNTMPANSGVVANSAANAAVNR